MFATRHEGIKKGKININSNSNTEFLAVNFKKFFYKKTLCPFDGLRTCVAPNPAKP